MQRQKGFTLMELMITMAIIAIVAAVAYPAYTKSAMKGRRAEGKAALTQAAQILERCYATYGVYNNTNCTEYCNLTGGSGCASSSAITSQPHQYYNITGTVNGTAYTITATAPSTSIQYQDTNCTTFALNSSGQQLSGTSTTSDQNGCW